MFGAIIQDIKRHGDKSYELFYVIPMFDLLIIYEAIKKSLNKFYFQNRHHASIQVNYDK